MPRTYRSAAIALLGVTGLSYAGYQYHEHQIEQSKERSLQIGIQRTQQQLNQLDEQIADSITDQTVLPLKVVSDILLPQGSGALAQLLKLDQHADLAQELASGDYQLALSTALEEMVGFFENSIKGLSHGEVLPSGVAKIDLAADVAETYIVLRDQAQMIATRDELFQELLRLQGSDPPTLAQWQRIYAQLHGDPTEEHQAFLHWLDEQHISKQDLMRKISDDLKANPKAAAAVARGIAIVDPNQDLSLDGVPGINPDFVEAIQRCVTADKEFANGVTEYGSLDPPRGSECVPFEADLRDEFTLKVAHEQGCFADQAHAHAIERLWQARADEFWCNKYADGSYIPAFGIPRNFPPSFSQNSQPGNSSKSQPSAEALTAPLQQAAQKAVPDGEPTAGQGAYSGTHLPGSSDRPDSTRRGTSAGSSTLRDASGQAAAAVKTELEGAWDLKYTRHLESVGGYSLHPAVPFSPPAPEVHDSAGVEYVGFGRNSDGTYTAAYTTSGFPCDSGTVSATLGTALTQSRPGVYESKRVWVAPDGTKRRTWTASFELAGGELKGRVVYENEANLNQADVRPFHEVWVSNYESGRFDAMVNVQFMEGVQRCRSSAAH